MSKFFNHKIFIVSVEGLCKEFRSRDSAQAFCLEHNLDFDECTEIFDSNKEYHRWELLQSLEQQGKITNLKRQVEYILVPAQYEQVLKKIRKKEVLKDKRVEAPITYKADFVYNLPDGKLIVEDVKSNYTRKLPEYIIKRKLMLYIHNIKLTEVI